MLHLLLNAFLIATMIACIAVAVVASVMLFARFR